MSNIIQDFITGIAVLLSIVTGGANQPEPVVGAFSDPFLSVQLAASPSNGNCLSTDGTNNVWGGCASGGSGVFPFSATTNFGQVVYATNTPTLWFQGGMFASSTSWFSHATTTSFNARFASSTFASTTQLSVTGSATTTLASGVRMTASPGLFDFFANASNPTARSGLYFFESDPTASQFAFLYDGSSTGNNNKFVWADPTTNTDLMTLLRGGQLGIGTSSPYAKLSVVGETVASHFTATTTSTSTLPQLDSTGIQVATHLDVDGTIDLNGVSGNSWDDFCVTITGGSGLCDGNDASGAGGSGTVSTSTNETAGNLAYWTSNSATPALLGQVATTTLTGTSPLSLSNPVAKVGGSNSVLSWDFSVANIWTGLQRFNAAASSTQFSATRAYFGGTATTTITNTGFIGIASSSPTYALTIEGGSATTPFVAVGSVDNFIQGVVWNKNSGTTASADWTASNNLSCPEATCGYYVDLGINSSNYSNATYSASGANDSYLYANDDNLVIGTASTTDLTASLIFTSGGFTTSHERMRLTRGGLFGFGTTTPNLSFLTIASSTAPQLSLSAGAGIPQWTFRNAGGNLYLSTTTLAGTATSTPAALTLQPGSTALGIASTTFSGMLGIGPATSNGSSTVAAGKFQVDGYTSNGVRYCAFFNNAGVWATSTGACNQ